MGLRGIKRGRQGGGHDVITVGSDEAPGSLVDPWSMEYIFIQSHL
jgi:hypothetical protein